MFAASYIFYIVLLAFFCIMRIYRNSLGYDSAGSGGVWNIISIFFVFSAILMFFNVIQRKFVFPLSIKLALCFSLVAQFNCIFFINRFDLGFIYNYLMIGFCVSVLIVFFVASQVPLSKKQVYTSNFLLLAVIVMSFISVFLFRSGFLDFSMVSNAYYALCILPLILMFTEKKRYRYFLYVFIGLIVIFSGKRTGLIAFGSFVIIVSLLESLKNNQLFSFVKTVGFLLGAGIIFYLLYIKFASVYDLKLFERMSNIAEDGGSGRNIMYQQIWNAMKESNVISWMIGHGYGRTEDVLVMHAAAHNDFLEILYDYGFFAVVFFILFYIQLFREGIAMYRSKFKYASLFIGEIIISILLSFFSIYCVSFTYVICGMASLGTILGYWYQHNRIMILGETYNEINNGDNSTIH